VALSQCDIQGRLVASLDHLNVEKKCSNNFVAFSVVSQSFPFPHVRKIKPAAQAPPPTPIANSPAENP
jgi:hypothetical protein